VDSEPGPGTHRSLLAQACIARGNKGKKGAGCAWPPAPGTGRGQPEPRQQQKNFMKHQWLMVNAIDIKISFPDAD